VPSHEFGGGRRDRNGGPHATFNGLTAVDHLNLSIQKGAMFGFLGRNGAGKSTTVKLLSTILRPSSGKARIGGHDVTRERKEVRRLIGVVGEGIESTRPFWTSRDYLVFFLVLHGHTRRQAMETAERWLERLDLAEYRNRPIGDFSSGMRKRLELCRALSHDPEVLLLDEPTKDLDIPGKREMWDFLRALSKEEQVTVFLCSHEVAEIQALCEDIAVIRSGKLRFVGPLNSVPDSVFKVTGISHKDTPTLEGLPLQSYSRTGVAVYLAFKDKVTSEEVRKAVDPKGLAAYDVEEVHSFDERMLAFL
jgi:ABC-2 type transport system ATP-binding protein